MAINIKNLQKQFKEETKKLDVDTLYVKYLGKKGEINKLFDELKNLSKDARIESAKGVNKLKEEITEKIEYLRSKSQLEPAVNSEQIDLSIPVKPSKIGNLHPLTMVTNNLIEFFNYYGFSVYDGPEIEDDYHNFEMLGVPKDHPARELQDTLYLLEPEILLRTQTSSIESRELEKQDPPIRFICPGKVYRNETANKSNSALFHQFQGVLVDRDVNLGNLKWIFEKSLKHVLGQDTIIRFRPKYYPEVEPGLSPDIQCKFCNGEGCDICKHRGWIEIAGGGMIHPETLEKAGINSEEYSGFAFGWGLDRIAMTKYNVRDIRVLYDGSIVYE